METTTKQDRSKSPLYTTTRPAALALEWAVFDAREALNAFDAIEYTVGGPKVEAAKARYTAAKKALADFEAQFGGGA